MEGMSEGAAHNDRLFHGALLKRGCGTLIYFSAEKDVGMRIWLLMLATMGPSRSLSSRALCQAGSFWNAVHLVSRSASDSHWSM
jgi:hypothetical protein